MLLGHTGLNWALKYLPAYVVNLTLLGEPVGATFLAATLPGIRELPGFATFAGGGLILARHLRRRPVQRANVRRPPRDGPTRFAANGRPFSARVSD